MPAAADNTAERPQAIIRVFLILTPNAKDACWSLATDLIEIPIIENLKKPRNIKTRDTETTIITNTMEDGERIKGKALLSAPHIKPTTPPIY